MALITLEDRTFTDSNLVESMIFSPKKEDKIETIQKQWRSLIGNQQLKSPFLSIVKQESRITKCKIDLGDKLPDSPKGVIGLIQELGKKCEIVFKVIKPVKDESAIDSLLNQLNSLNYSTIAFKIKETDEHERRLLTQTYPHLSFKSPKKLYDSPASKKAKLSDKQWLATLYNHFAEESSPIKGSLLDLMKAALETKLKLSSEFIQTFRLLYETSDQSLNTEEKVYNALENSAIPLSIKIFDEQQQTDLDDSDYSKTKILYILKRKTGQYSCLGPLEQGKWEKSILKPLLNLQQGDTNSYLAPPENPPPVKLYIKISTPIDERQTFEAIASKKSTLHEAIQVFLSKYFNKTLCDQFKEYYKANELLSFCEGGEIALCKDTLNWLQKNPLNGADLFLSFDILEGQLNDDFRFTSTANTSSNPEKDKILYLTYQKGLYFFLQPLKSAQAPQSAIPPVDEKVKEHIEKIPGWIELFKSIEDPKEKEETVLYDLKTMKDKIESQDFSYISLLACEACQIPEVKQLADSYKNLKPELIKKALIEYLFRIWINTRFFDRVEILGNNHCLFSTLQIGIGSTISNFREELISFMASNGGDWSNDFENSVNEADYKPTFLVSTFMSLLNTQYKSYFTEQGYTLLSTPKGRKEFCETKLDLEKFQNLNVNSQSLSELKSLLRPPFFEEIFSSNNETLAPNSCDLKAFLHRIFILSASESLFSLISNLDEMDIDLDSCTKLELGHVPSESEDKKLADPHDPKPTGGEIAFIPNLIKWVTLYARDHQSILPLMNDQIKIIAPELNSDERLETRLEQLDPSKYPLLKRRLQIVLYCTEMMNSSSWGGYLEIQALNDYVREKKLDSSVEVKLLDATGLNRMAIKDNRPFDDVLFSQKKSSGKTIWAHYRDVNQAGSRHYDLLVPKRDIKIIEEEIPSEGLTEYIFSHLLRHDQQTKKSESAEEPTALRLTYQQFAKDFEGLSSQEQLIQKFKEICNLHRIPPVYLEIFSEITPRAISQIFSLKDNDEATVSYIRFKQEKSSFRVVYVENDPTDLIWTQQIQDNTMQD